MRYRKLLALFLAPGLLALPGCVAKKKYTSATGHVQRLQADSTAFEQQLTQKRATISGMGTALGERDQRIAELEGGLQEAQDRLADRESLLARKESELVDKAMRMDDLNRRLDAQTNALNSLRRKVADALVNFRSDELTVTMKEGKVYVSLAEKLLFKSGSAEVDPKGKEAIGQLAQVLNANPDIGVMVEGHTDTIPIASGRFKDNWELSTARATSIVRLLTMDHKLDPKRVTAAGRGEWIPVASNSDAEGRARNRRTDIILTPDLQELFDLVGGP